ncbi:inhibitor of nuclear factor kappa-B kinase-interacting protein isoform X1 [Scleropages formosus]|nr:inhibitor of nuclear factor kappa-B kinase-interacting protein isoform X1 [Scleropages formosus]
MPASEIKQRKRGANETKQGKQLEEEREPPPGPSGDTSGGRKAAEMDGAASSQWSSAGRAGPRVSAALWVAVCLGLAWFALHQNGRLAELEQKCGRAAELLELRERVTHLSDKLDSSEDDVQGAFSSRSLGAQLEQEISSLRAAIVEEQDRESSASRDIQALSERFMNVTEAWQGGLEHVAEDMGTLRAEARAAHGLAAQRVNQAEARLRSLEERLEEVEEGTRRNARALERTEEDDILRVRDLLDWNTEQLRKLEEQQRGLVRRDAELRYKLEEHLSRAQRREEQLPAVKECVHTILLLSAKLGATQRRVEELTLQVLDVEGSMLKIVSEILELRQTLDTLQKGGSAIEIKSDLSVFKETGTGLQGDSMEDGTEHGPLSQQEAPEETTRGA